MTKCSFQYSVRTCTRHAQSFGLKECQLAFTEQRTTDIYLYIYENSTVQLASMGLAQACPNHHSTKLYQIKYHSFVAIGILTHVVHL